MRHFETISGASGSLFAFVLFTDCFLLHDALFWFDVDARRLEDLLVKFSVSLNKLDSDGTRSDRPRVAVVYSRSSLIG